MTRSIRHRGPEDEGYAAINTQKRSIRSLRGDETVPPLRAHLDHVLSGGSSSANLLFGHRRYGIIDPTPAGHQPFIDPAGEFCLIFNGEIYNYVEIRKQLESEGINFQTRTDTEVFCQALKVWGDNAFLKLNGFWSLLAYDQSRNRLLASRDRVGKNGLYWTRIEDSLYFASEIKSLLAVRRIWEKRGRNNAVIEHYLNFLQRDINQETFFQGIYQFPTGSFSEITPDFPTAIKRFWSIPQQRMTEAEISVEEACSEVRQILDDSVRLRIRSDVPWCVELSGGLDSSAILALSSRQTNSPVTAYTIELAGDASELCNETDFARQAARRSHAIHHVVHDDIEHVLNQLMHKCWLFDEPTIHATWITHQTLRQQMRKDGFKILLQGIGGDELLAGYEIRYFHVIQFELLLRGYFSGFWSNARNWTMADSPWQTTRMMLKELIHLVGHRTKVTLREIFQNWASGRTRRDSRDNQHYKREISGSAFMHKQFNELIPYWLTGCDRANMGIPIEARAPFLDYRFIELCFRLPLGYLVRDGWHKWILRKAMEDILPSEVIWRKRKWGFPFPRNRFAQYCQPALNLIKTNSEFGQSNRFNEIPYGHHWSLMSLALWNELFMRGDSSLFRRLKSVYENPNHQELSNAYVEYLHSPFPEWINDHGL